MNITDSRLQYQSCVSQNCENDYERVHARDMSGPDNAWDEAMKEAGQECLEEYHDVLQASADELDKLLAKDLGGTE